MTLVRDNPVVPVQIFSLVRSNALISVVYCVDLSRCKFLASNRHCVGEFIVHRCCPKNAGKRPHTPCEPHWLPAHIELVMDGRVVVMISVVILVPQFWMRTTRK